MSAICTVFENDVDDDGMYASYAKRAEAILRERVFLKLTFSRSIAFIAPSIPRTTPAMLPVTCRIVTAVCTLLATASMREPSRRRLSFSFCFRIAFWA